MMNSDFPESDWKRYKRIHALALERYYSLTLDSIIFKASDHSLPIRHRYMETYKLVREKDQLINVIFEQYSRSRALQQLSLMYAHKLVTDEELGTLSLIAYTKALLAQIG